MCNDRDNRPSPGGSRDLDLLRLRMVRELEEFLNRAMHLKLPRLKIRPNRVAKVAFQLN